jgi:uncharacterized repeat protein (TIGR03837 family)
MRQRHWDIFCRVIDNHGDVGVCWRLARELGARGEAVRLWLDDASALAWMAPGGAAGVELVPWSRDAPPLAPQDVVVEAFGCDPPPGFVAAMAASKTPPLWINLEYLSAESYVERSHALPSPQLHGAGVGLTKWFFYPGFTPRTGGLLREQGLMARRDAFKRDAWLAQQGIASTSDERIVSVFCYPGAPLLELAQTLATQPTLLLLTPGAAQDVLRDAVLPPQLRCIALPWLTQDDYDHLLWSSDLNIVRGEDSFVRAMWAGAPFIWHLYPQHDGAHAAKLDAFANNFDAQAVPGLGALWRRWNAVEPGPLQLPEQAPWRAATQAWQQRLLAQDDLCTQLLGFVRGKEPRHC